MLLPVALLAGAGLFVSRNPNALPFARDNGPLRLVIERAEVVPITPREVFEGYDTKIEIVGNKMGRSIKPQNGLLETVDSGGTSDPHLALKHGPKKIRYRSLNDGDLMREAMTMGRHAVQTTILLKMASLPITKQDLLFRAEVESNQRYVVAAPNSGRRITLNERIAAPVEILVRHAGKKILVPKPSQYCPLKIESKEIIPLSKFIPDRGEDTLVSIHLSNTENPEKPYFRVARNSAYIEDEHGKRYRRFLYNAFPARRYWNDIEHSLMTKDAGGAAVKFPLPLRQIPASAGRLTLHADIYVNDCWPRHVSVVVRDK